jgi:hypothetical protein
MPKTPDSPPKPKSKPLDFETFVRGAMQTGKAPPAPPMPKKAKLGKIAKAKRKKK